MARYYLDSSALVKRYHREVGSELVAALFNETGSRLFVSRLALVEVQSSFARLVREQVLSEPDFEKLIARIEADVGCGILSVAAMSGPRLEAASMILRTHGLKYSLRTLDAIHLATAHALHRRSQLAGFVAADKKLLASADAACGLTIVEVC